jgi:hypothetical protein
MATGRNIQNGQSSSSKSNAIFYVNAGIIRAAVLDRVIEAPDGVLGDRLTGAVDDSADATHDDVVPPSLAAIPQDAFHQGSSEANGVARPDY